MVVRKKRKAPKKKAAVRHAKPEQLADLAKLTAVEMVGFIALELVLWVLVLADIIPPSIVIKRVGLLEISMNTGYLIIVGLVAVLVASFWLAILVQFDMIRLEKMEFRL